MQADEPTAHLHGRPHKTGCCGGAFEGHRLPMPWPMSPTPITRSSTAITVALLACSQAFMPSSGPRIFRGAMRYVMTGTATVAST